MNNAGIIKVGPFVDMNRGDFEEAMKVIFWGTLHATLAVIPAMRVRKQGSIVNITSIGGKVSVPHLLPYSCAKFATVAFSEGLRNELAPAGIRVTTIAPGLLRTGSHLNAEFKGNQAAEYAWFAAGAATPFVSIWGRARRPVDCACDVPGNKRENPFCAGRCSRPAAWPRPGSDSGTDEQCKPVSAVRDRWVGKDHDRARH